jgi:adenine-specific DNA-methyltransferase
VRDARRSFGDPASESMLVHGDNLRAMRKLALRFEGRFACAYLDPPFNTGRTFAEYTDRLPPADWERMMHERLLALRPLLAPHGAVFVEIDDNELATLQLLLDAVFGRENRISTITIVRSATTGHKAINVGPVNVTDFLLVYAKDRARFRPRSLVRPRAGHDPAYATVLANPEASPDGWRFSPLAREVAGSLGYETTRGATLALGRERFAAELARFALANAERVVRFAQPRYEAVSHAARRMIDQSRKNPERVLVLERPGHKAMILRGGNRILRLADKVRDVDGVRTLVEPLTNVWDDVPFQGIAREGGVVFARNKKPERLLARILDMATQPGEWVLDPFLGSGTTAAVAHKMGRKWVGIEQGSQLDELCIPRLRRVVQGHDASGVTAASGWRKGGGFGVWT